ncbi:hypothetical protein H5410_058150 [Solanum commersonii]|uniref:Uncharacterized protein n=1 Tax=Solanum commersonii TaxID=4109 RepID=A0A9J5WSQ2_SOLCO|nr:hypothetical protein H5410_058150 [Solanum commersonii]
MVWTCEKADDAQMVRRCEGLVVEGTRRGRGRPKKYWGEVKHVDREASFHLHVQSHTSERKKECIC